MSPGMSGFLPLSLRDGRPGEPRDERLPAAQAADTRDHRRPPQITSPRAPDCGAAGAVSVFLR